MTDPTRHPDAEALLAAICANPDDDTPRLVYADWLDDHGDEVWQARAAFIREQVRVAAGRPPPHGPVGEPADTLIFRHYETWWQEVPEWLRTEPNGRPTPARAVNYSRGFWSRAQLDAGQWLRGVDHPRLRVPLNTLRIHRGPDLGRVGEVPQLATVRELIFLYALPTGDDFARIAGSPYLGPVRSLGFPAFLAPSVLSLLAGSPAFRHVTRLSVPSGPTVPELVEAGSRLTSLTELIIEPSFRLGAGDLARLAAGPGLSRITRLDLTVSGALAADAGLDALAGSAHVAGLRSLWLRCDRLGEGACRSLAESPYLTGLTEFRLTVQTIGRADRNRLRRRFPFVEFK